MYENSLPNVKNILLNINVTYKMMNYIYAQKTNFMHNHLEPQLMNLSLDYFVNLKYLVFWGETIPSRLLRSW